MGFIKEVYSSNRAGLIVSFGQEQSSENFFHGDSVEEAIEYFNMYLKNNELYVQTEDAVALENLSINPEDATEFRSSVDAILTTLTDEQAVENIILFPVWSINTNYKINDRVRYNNTLYRALQDHTSQADWTPSTAVSLFARVLNETEDNSIPEWTQPESTEGYMIGDQVMYNGILYTSTADNNVWEPGTVGAPWEAKEEGTESTGTMDWVSGALYNIGDRVFYEGIEYESLIDNNSWSPAEYPAGWEQVVEEAI